VARVATRIAIDHWRRSRGPQEALDAGTAATHVPDLVTSFWVRWSLASLSPKQRAAFLLRHLEGRSVEEVASALGSSRETVKSHLKAAVRRLRSILVEDADG
jgi:RNA polymerase sigma factor (sigma-70 family)